MRRVSLESLKGRHAIQSREAELHEPCGLSLHTFADQDHPADDERKAVQMTKLVRETSPKKEINKEK
jgi:hypothetical protein